MSSHGHYAIICLENWNHIFTELNICSRRKQSCLTATIVIMQQLTLMGTLELSSTLLHLHHVCLCVLTVGGDMSQDSTQISALSFTV